MARKDLHNLIRLRKWDVDEKQRALAVLLRHEEAVLERLTALDEEVRGEMAFASKIPVEQRRTLAPFLERCDRMRDQLRAALQEVRLHLARAQEQLGEAYRRLKTFEITQELRDVAEQKEFDRVETIDLNEIGANLHRRKTAQELV